VYLVVLGVWAGLGRFNELRWMAIPLGCYVVAVLASAVALIPRGGVVRSLCAIPFIALTHVFYGAGFWRGLFTSLKPSPDKPKTTVELENVPLG
jgi:hypothetical protein